MTRRTKKILWVGGAALLIAALGAAWWVRRFHTYTPLAALLDLRAAAQADGAERPVERFLELRYGPLTEPANRQKAFLDFFDLGHIEGLHLIVNKMGGQEKPIIIDVMAQWIADYRHGLSAEEREALSAYLSSAAGRAQVHDATVRYLQKDVQFRAATAPVIQELMTTLAILQKK